MSERKSKILDPIIEKLLRDHPGMAYNTIRSRTQGIARASDIGVVTGMLVRQSVTNLVKANKVRECLELRGEYEAFRYYIIEDGFYNDSKVTR
jgi:hypothetical protein